MLNKLKMLFKKIFLQLRIFFIMTLGKACMHLLFMTCRKTVTGLEQFLAIGEKERTLIMLWHNRLAITPCILARYAPDFTYAALVSASRDGKLLKALVESYKKGRTINVGHQARYQALREVIRAVEQKQTIVIMTPDGPRGPCYQMKPGVAMIALETGAQVIALNWEAKHYWQLSTWDKLRFPKPFTTITISFTCIPAWKSPTDATIDEVKAKLKDYLPK